MTPTPDLASVVARLEKENRNLLTRLEKLEQQRGSALRALIANMILILAAAVLVGYLGLFPPGIARLPLQARSVETEAIILRGSDSSSRTLLMADNKGLHICDEDGKELRSTP
jgi:hypothetical protein